MAPRSAPSAPPGAPAAPVPAPRIVGRAFSEMVARCRVGERRVNAPRFFGPWLRLIEQTVQKVACSDKRLSSSISSLFARPPAHSHPRAPCSSAPSRARPPPRTRGAGGAPAGRRRKPQIPRSEHQKHLDELCACRAPERRFFRFPFNGPRHHAREASSATRETRSFASRPTSDPKLPSSPSSSLDVPHDSQGSRAQRAVPGARAPRPAAARARARGARRCRARASPARRPVGAYPGANPRDSFESSHHHVVVDASEVPGLTRGASASNGAMPRQPRRRRHPPVPVVGRRRGRYRRSRPRRPRRPSRSHAAGRRRRASRSVRRVRRGDGVARRLPEPRRHRRSANARGGAVGRLPRAPRRGRGVPRPFGPRPETLEGTVVRGGGRGPDRDALRRARGARGGAGRGEARGSSARSWTSRLRSRSAPRRSGRSAKKSLRFATRNPSARVRRAPPRTGPRQTTRAPAGASTKRRLRFTRTSRRLPARACAACPAAA